MSLRIKILAIMITGLMGALIYPAVFFGYKLPDVGFLGWFFLVPILMILYHGEGKNGFVVGFFSAFIFYWASLYWMIPAMTHFGGLSPVQSVGVLCLIVLILSSYFGVSLWCGVKVWHLTKLPFFVVLPFFLVSFDFLRTYFPVGGFPWSMPAYSQGKYLTYFQWIELTGVYGLNYLIFVVNVLLAEIFSVNKKINLRDRLINRSVILILVIIASFGTAIICQKRFEAKKPLGRDYRVALIQGEISQGLKWDPKLARDNLKKHLDLTKKAEGNGAELAIWPETAYPYTLELLDLGRHSVSNLSVLTLPVIMGSVSQLTIPHEMVPKIFNSAFLLDGKGHIKGVYHKRHLVPFGEYVPLRKLLTFAKTLTEVVGDFSKGKEASLLLFDELRVGVLICYEDIFPDLARHVVGRGANILVNLTNDAWYGNTSAQYQHLVFSQFRALENRRYLLRSTNSGITAMINPRGEVIKQLEPFKADILLSNVFPIKHQTLFYLLGNYVAWICIIFALSCTIYALFKKYGRKRV